MDGDQVPNQLLVRLVDGAALPLPGAEHRVVVQRVVDDGETCRWRSHRLQTGHSHPWVREPQ